MYDKNTLSLKITIDTVYGFISKYAETSVKDIAKEETLDEYLTQVFSTIKHVIKEDFNRMKEAGNGRQ
jgi:hypothetical protein